MQVLLRSNDPVLITYVQSILADENIECFVMDQHTSILEGSIGAIPRRIMVGDDDLSRARWAVNTAEGTRGWFDGSKADAT